MSDDNPSLSIEDAYEIVQLVREVMPVEPVVTAFDIRMHRATIDAHKARVKAAQSRATAADHFAYMAGALSFDSSDGFVKLLEIRLDEAAELLEMAAKNDPRVVS